MWASSVEDAGASSDRMQDEELFSLVMDALEPGRGTPRQQPQPLDATTMALLGPQYQQMASMPEEAPATNRFVMPEPNYAVESKRLTSPILAGEAEQAALVRSVLRHTQQLHSRDDAAQYVPQQYRPTTQQQQQRELSEAATSYAEALRQHQEEQRRHEQQQQQQQQHVQQLVVSGDEPHGGHHSSSSSCSSSDHQQRRQRQQQEHQQRQQQELQQELQEQRQQQEQHFMQQQQQRHQMQPETTEPQQQQQQQERAPTTTTTTTTKKPGLTSFPELRLTGREYATPEQQRRSAEPQSSDQVKRGEDSVARRRAERELMCNFALQTYRAAFSKSCSRTLRFLGPNNVLVNESCADNVFCNLNLTLNGWPGFLRYMEMYGWYLLPQRRRSRHSDGNISWMHFVLTDGLFVQGMTDSEVLLDGPKRRDRRVGASSIRGDILRRLQISTYHPGVHANRGHGPGGTAPRGGGHSRPTPDTA